MDAIEYIKEKLRMSNNCRLECFKCPVGRKNNGHNIDCTSFEVEYPEESVAIVENWSRTHPQMTRKDYLLKHFPDTEIDEIGSPKTCPKNLGLVKDCPNIKCVDCWNMPYEEE